MKINLTHKIIALLILYVLGLCNCTKDDPTSDIVVGKNSFTINIDGVLRKYEVHVPSTYKGNDPVPMVIMCHGSGQSGEQFYNISGWKEVGDSLNFLTVFPSALEYCTIEDGVMKFGSKWNSYPGGDLFCDGQDIKNDIEFMRQMISALENKYKIDSKRIYMVGFSSGGQFTATCAIEISDIIAASISCGGGGSFPIDSVYTPKRLLPVMLMFGNKDGKLIKGLGLPENSAVPMGFEALYTSYPFLYLAQVKTYIHNFKLNESNYTIAGDTQSVVTADYVGLSGNPNNIFKLVEAKGLEHEYPNGKNYPLRAAEFHWNWFKNYSLP